MNPILAAALAMFPDALNIDTPKPKTPDPERQAAAQAKRERKAAKRKRDNRTSKVNQIVALAVKTHPSVKAVGFSGSTVFIDRNPEQDWIDSYDLTAEEEAEAEALAGDGGAAMDLARRFAGEQRKEGV